MKEKIFEDGVEINFVWWKRILMKFPLLGRFFRWLFLGRFYRWNLDSYVFPSVKSPMPLNDITELAKVQPICDDLAKLRYDFLIEEQKTRPLTNSEIEEIISYSLSTEAGKTKIVQMLADEIRFKIYLRKYSFIDPLPSHDLKDDEV